MATGKEYAGFPGEWTEEEQLSMNSVIIFDHVVEKAILFSLDFVSSHTHVRARL